MNYKWTAQFKVKMDAAIQEKYFISGNANWMFGNISKAFYNFNAVRRSDGELVLIVVVVTKIHGSIDIYEAI